MSEPTTGAEPGGGGVPEVEGLRHAEVEQRRRLGLVNRLEQRSSRRVADIVRENLLTRFNAIISALVAVVLVFGHPVDALFGVVMVVNALIGIVQELRAKRTLDRLQVLVAPEVTVVRDGIETTVPVGTVVQDDLMVLGPGDQVPADGRVVSAAGLQMDESLLTGEADPVDKAPGDTILSGSFVVAGTGRAVAVAVGDDAYANRLAAEAKEFALTHGELRTGVDRILRYVTWLLLPTAALLLWSQFRSGSNLAASLVSAVAGVVGMVPQGLVLLVSMSMAVAVVRLGRNHALVQELPAVETLARVDVLCIDKTGTLTTGSIGHRSTVPLGPISRAVLETALGAIAAADPRPNATMRALAAAYPRDPGWTPRDTIPFSSERKYSAVTFADHGTWVVGSAPQVLGASAAALQRRLAALAAAGHRVLVVAHAAAPIREDSLPVPLTPVGYLTFTEEIRPDAPETVRFFAAQHVVLKVISGDDPGTVATIAGSVGVPGAEDPVDLARLGDPTAEELADLVEEKAVFGRVTPEWKREMVRALQARGHTVAMTGDGVNDVSALKRADIGVAMGSGAPASRAVAQIVLLDDRFASLPRVVAEGRRIIANMERVAKLFITKTVYATLLALLIGFAQLPFPLLPRHLTLIGSLTIGIPAFVLSFESSDEPARSGFLGRVLRFAVPAGIVAGLVGFEVYGLARFAIVGAGVDETRSTVTLTMAIVGLVVLVELIRPLSRVRRRLVVILAGLLAATFAVPWARELFALGLPGPETWLVVGVGVGSAVVSLQLLVRLVAAATERVERRRSTTGPTAPPVG